MTFELSGDTPTYRRADGGAIDFHFCPNCGCITHYVAVKPGESGRHWTGVNVRLTEPNCVADLPIDHFDGLSYSKICHRRPVRVGCLVLIGGKPPTGSH